MNKVEFLKAVSEKSGLTPKDAEKALAAVSAVVKEAVAAGNELTVPGLCKVTVEHRNERTGKNPQTGAPLTTPARNVAKFRPAKEIRDAAPAVKA